MSGGGIFEHPYHLLNLSGALKTVFSFKVKQHYQNRNYTVYITGLHSSRTLSNLYLQNRGYKNPLHLFRFSNGRFFSSRTFWWIVVGYKKRCDQENC